MFNLKEMTTLYDVQEAISTPHMEITREGPLWVLYFDDGNESSWGEERWIETDGHMLLVSITGRDCFDSGLTDCQFSQYFSNLLALDSSVLGNYAYHGWHPIWVKNDQFDIALGKTIEGWKERSKEAG